MTPARRAIRTLLRATALPLLIFLSVVTSGCHCLINVRIEQKIYTQSEEATLGLWVEGRPLAQPDLADAIAVSLLLYPFDILLSTEAALLAPFEPSYEVRWGPIGALAAIVLPGLTLMGNGGLGEGPLVLDPAEFERLVEAGESGNTLEVYRELSVNGGWDTPVGLLAVEVLSVGTSDVDWTR